MTSATLRSSPHPRLIAKADDTAQATTSAPSYPPTAAPAAVGRQSFSRARDSAALACVEELVVAEIVSNSTFQADCAVAWVDIMGASVGPDITPPDMAELSTFEKRIRAQYSDIFLPLSGLPPMRNDGGSRIHTLPEARPPYRIPCRMTPHDHSISNPQSLIAVVIASLFIVDVHDVRCRNHDRKGRFEGEFS